jgi:hypothetical protein
METPYDKKTGSIFARHNLFTSSSKLLGNEFFNFNTMSNSTFKDKENIFLNSNQSHNNNPFNQVRNFSFSKFMKTSTCKKQRKNIILNNDTARKSTGKKKLKFSECRKIYYDPEEEENNPDGNKIKEKNSDLKIQTPSAKEILRLNVKSSKFKISSVNFNINFSYMK